MAYAAKRLRGADSWELRVCLGRGRDHYRRIHGTAAQADAALAAFRSEMEDQGAPPAHPGTRFAAWAATYMQLRPDLAGQTREAYQRILTRHVLPALGARRLSQIRAADGIELQQRLLAAKLAPVTVNAAMRLATHILDDAARARVIPANPFTLIRHVKGRAGERDFMAPTSFGALDRLPAGDVADILRLGLATGMRRGELLGLRWRDVEAECMSVSVLGSVEAVSGERPARKEPKTRAGRRKVTLPPAGMTILRRRRLAAREAALAAGRDWLELPVFPASDGLSWAIPNMVSRSCRIALHRIGIGDTLHGMRHAHATALLADGVNPRAVQARLGHSDIKTTLGLYGHLLPGEDNAAADVIATLMGKVA